MPKTTNHNRALRFLAACALVALSVTTDAQDTDTISIDIESPPWQGDLDGMIKRRVIRVLVPYSKTLYFIDAGGRQRGISYDYMHAFEEQLNKKLKRGTLRIQVIMIPVPRDQLLPALIAGRGDIVAANLTITPPRQAIVDFSSPLARNVNEIVVTGPKAPALASIDYLAGKSIFVRKETSYYESLTALNHSFAERKMPVMILREAPGHFETEDLLEMVNAGLVDIVVADAYLAKLWEKVYTDLRVHEDIVLRTEGDIGFAVRKGSPKFLAELNAFSRTHRQGTTFGNITLQKYLQQTRWVKNATTESELKRLGSLVDLFQKYGERYRVDWLLMAAQGYQESQLDQRKRSHVGAIGVMQVMPATGQEMRVGNIEQLEPNIHAGVKYIRYLIDTYFQDPSIDEVNKVLLAFAAYNAGPSRIRSLRRETKQRGLNPNVWFDNVERVVAQRVGRETVQYVSNIYKYYIAYSLAQDNVRKDLVPDKP